MSQQYCSIIYRWHAAEKIHHAPATLAPAHAPCLFSIDLHTVRQHLVIARFFASSVWNCIFQMMSGVPHHCHHLSLVWGHTCCVQYTKAELFLWLLYICEWFGLVIALIIIMVIFKCYFSGEHITLSWKKQQRCEHRIRKNQQIKSTVHDAN